MSPNYLLCWIFLRSNHDEDNDENDDNFDDEDDCILMMTLILFPIIPTTSKSPMPDQSGVAGLVPAVKIWGAS